MKEFEIEVEEILQRIVKIEAENREEAINRAKEKYIKEEIILDEDDFKEVNFK